MPIFIGLIGSLPRPRPSGFRRPRAEGLCDPRGGVAPRELFWDTKAEAKNPVLYEGECARNRLRLLAVPKG